MAIQRRVDPEDGLAYTFDELAHFYGQSYSSRDIQSYWQGQCTPYEVVPAKQAKAKAKTKATAKGKAKAKAKVTDDPSTLPAKATAKGKAKAKAKAKATEADAGVSLKKTMERREADWRIGPVVYQVFVDRFAPPADLDAKRHLYPSPCTLHQWEEQPKPGQCNEETKYYEHELAFWGGDLTSLTSKLSYIQDLGADVLYLQPIVEAFSNHKYDTSDYLKVDPQYGTLDDFKTLAASVHELDMRLVLDGVFNHMGVRSACFKEAEASAEADKRGWFLFGEEYKTGCKTWGGSSSLVELHLENPDLQQFIWKGKESVFAHWLSLGTDGWRLDVASEIGFRLLRSMTLAAHRHKRGSLVVGEVWAYPPQWTSAMDGVLSLHLGVLLYGLADGSCPGPSAAQSIERMIADSSIEEVLRSWIVVSNHDMPRLATRLPDLKLRMFVQTLQFLWPGSPLVYYGDELGLAGGDDPHNRATMPWAEVKDDNEMLQHTRKMVAMRKRLRALRIGNYRALVAQHLMAFIRSTEKVMDVVVVLANPTDKPVKEMVVLPVPAILGHTLFRDELSGEEVRVLGSTITADVASKGVRVFTLVHEQGPSGDQYKRMYGHPATFKHIKP